MGDLKLSENEYKEYFLKMNLLVDVIETRLELLVSVLKQVTNLGITQGEVVVNIVNFTSKLESVIGQTKIALEEIKNEINDMFIENIKEDDKLAT